MQTALAEKADGKISWLIVDAPVKKVKLARNTHICTFQLVPKDDFRLALGAYRQGVAAVVPRPVTGQENFMDEFIMLLEFMPEFIQRLPVVLVEKFCCNQKDDRYEDGPDEFCPLHSDKICPYLCPGKLGDPH